MNTECATTQTIQFTFEGKEYEAPYSFYETGRHTLPDGREVECRGWLESLPPQPVEITLVKTSPLTPPSKKPETIGERWLRRCADLEKAISASSHPPTKDQQDRIAFLRDLAASCGAYLIAQLTAEQLAGDRNDVAMHQRFIAARNVVRRQASMLDIDLIVGAAGNAATLAMDDEKAETE